MRKKYIIVSHMDEELPVVFEEALTHSQVAGNMRVISGGFVEVYETGKIVTFGESVTLLVKSREEDSSILEPLFKCDQP